MCFCQIHGWSRSTENLAMATAFGWVQQSVLFALRLRSLTAFGGVCPGITLASLSCLQGGDTHGSMELFFFFFNCCLSCFYCSVILWAHIQPKALQYVYVRAFLETTLLVTTQLISVKLMVLNCFTVSSAETFSLPSVTGQNTNRKVTWSVLNLKTAKILIIPSSRWLQILLVVVLAVVTLLLAHRA